MNSLLILVAVIIVSCVLLNNASFRIGMPVLLAFIMLGMVFGNNGLVPVPMDSDGRAFVGDICTVALIFIMFYGGFGTSWKSARPVVVEAALLSSVGVILTAGITGVFCHFALRWPWLESLLMGAVVSSTDAASVFSILRSRKLGLKNHTAPLLELESGSNDPCSYMLTIIMLSLIGGDVSVGHTLWLFFSQLVFGALFGLLIAMAASYAIKRINFATSGFDSLFLVAVALISYALPSLVNGNGYLSAYIVGIVLGNQPFANKKVMVHFFDGVTGLMQVLIFFMLGLLAHPAELGHCILPALAIFAVMLIVSRPLSVAILLSPFKKYGFAQQALISFCGLRGAASIVFAILATTGGTALKNDMFNIVFCIVLISIALQGTLIPKVANRLSMTDPDSDVMKTFSDFSEEVNLQFSEVKVSAGNTWAGKTVMELSLPANMLFTLIIRDDGSRVVPNGRTLICEGDTLVLCSKTYSNTEQQIKVIQRTVTENNQFCGRKVKELPSNKGQLMMIQRGQKTIIPNGSTVLCAGDVLYINQSN